MGGLRRLSLQAVLAGGGGGRLGDPPNPALPGCASLSSFPSFPSGAQAFLGATPCPPPTKETLHSDVRFSVPEQSPDSDSTLFISPPLPRPFLLGKN